MQARQERGGEPFRAGLGGITACPTCRHNPDVREEPVKKKRRSLPKIASLPGTLREEYRRCGKATCRCARGDLHGPYLYRRWREAGRQRRRYVPARDANAVRAALAAWRRFHPPARSTREHLAELRRLTRQFSI